VDLDANGADGNSVDTGTLKDVTVQLAVLHGSYVTQTKLEDTTGTNTHYTWS